MLKNNVSGWVHDVGGRHLYDLHLGAFNLVLMPTNYSTVIVRCNATANINAVVIRQFVTAGAGLDGAFRSLNKPSRAAIGS